MERSCVGRGVGAAVGVDVGEKTSISMFTPSRALLAIFVGSADGNVLGMSLGILLGDTDGSKVALDVFLKTTLGAADTATALGVILGAPVP